MNINEYLYQETNVMSNIPVAKSLFWRFDVALSLHSKILLTLRFDVALSLHSKMLLTLSTDKSVCKD